MQITECRHRHLQVCQEAVQLLYSSLLGVPLLQGSIDLRDAYAHSHGMHREKTLLIDEDCNGSVIPDTQCV